MGQQVTCSAGKSGTPMSVDAARLRAEAVAVTVSETETLPLYMALERVLAEATTAHSALPPFEIPRWTATRSTARRCAARGRGR